VSHPYRDAPHEVRELELEIRELEARTGLWWDFDELEEFYAVRRELGALGQRPITHDEFADAIRRVRSRTYRNYESRFL
jgi:hypothetical protein